MSNTTTQNKIQPAGIKVGGKQTCLASLSTKVLNPTNPEFDRHDFRAQIYASCAISSLATHLPFVVSDAERFCSNPSAENLAHLDASLQLLAERVNSELRKR
jgi:hypothetical protein